MTSDTLDQSPAAPGRGLSDHLRRLPGGSDDAVWVRPSLLTLLAATAVLYVWGLGDSGWANSFYSAAVQAGAHSWKAFFFGSSDASNFITVDKPPASLWVMEISARLFGLSSWSVLVPQALEGVAAVGLLYATIRRWFGAVAGLMAGATLALTPVAALMFRFNNPDALLTLLLVGAAYATLRAVESGRIAWLVTAAALVGTGFLTKMLQAFLVVPAFALVFLLAAPSPLRRRVRALAAAALALVVASGWWVAIVQLVPSADRPYIGGSQDNSLISLILGYNGFGRLTGSESGSVGGGGATSRWGPTGWDRLFTTDFGGQISWLIPAAAIMLIAILWLRRRAPRADCTRAAFLVWGGWLAVTALVLSYAKGIIHPYYTVALAPAIAALVGMGAVQLWRARAEPVARLALAGSTAATAWWSWTLLGRTPGFHPALRPAILIAGLAAAAALAASGRLRPRAAGLAVTVATAAALAGPAAYTLDTAAAPHTGAIPSAGPAVATGFAGGGGLRGSRAGAPPGAPPTASRNGFGSAVPRAAPAPGGFGGGAAGGNPRAGSAPGGLLDSSSPGAQLVKLLGSGPGRFRWVAAAVGSNTAAGYQLASGDPVMAIGGFNGTDPTPTLAQFKAYVAGGTIHFFIASGRGIGSSSSATAIAAWVKAHFTSRTVDGVTVYDLT